MYTTPVYSYVRTCAYTNICHKHRKRRYICGYISSTGETKNNKISVCNESKLPGESIGQAGRLSHSVEDPLMILWLFSLSSCVVHVLEHGGLSSGRQTGRTSCVVPKTVVVLNVAGHVTQESRANCHASPPRRRALLSLNFIITYVFILVVRDTCVYLASNSSQTWLFSLNYF